MRTQMTEPGGVACVTAEADGGARRWDMHWTVLLAAALSLAALGDAGAEEPYQPANMMPRQAYSRNLSERDWMDIAVSSDTFGPSKP